jgi:hypothetical protein
MKESQFLFSERPVWTRNSLLYRLKDEEKNKDKEKEKGEVKFILFKRLCFLLLL